MSLLLTTEVRHEHDVVLTRQRARQVAGLLGFDLQDQTRIATAVSEVARNAFQYADGGRVEFHVDDEVPQVLRVCVRDRGPGIKDLQAILDGRVAPPGGTGLGLVGARRVMDRFEVESPPGGGTVVTIGKVLPRKVPAVAAGDLARIAGELARREPAGPFEEVQRQNQELLHTLEALRRHQAESAGLNQELERANRELRRREEDLVQLNRELEETNRGVVALYAELDERAFALQRVSELKSRFLSNMSHEFRTPLNSIRSLAKFLLDPADGPLSPEKERQVRYIVKAAESLSELVNDLLDLAKVEAGKVVLRPEEFAPADLFAALRGMFRPLLDPSSPVALVFEEPAGIAPLLTDEAKLAQILRNFISNALKFTERGEVRVGAADLPGDLVAFSVADTGIGIAPADLRLIFEEFTQVDSPVQKRVKGTGLGLPLSRKLAELLGGGVRVTSRPGAGSTFTVTIPRRLAGDEPAGAPSSPGVARPEVGREAPSARAAPGPILVIDDDPIARYLLKGLLAAETGRAVLEAADGREGLRRAREDRPRAIFLDLIMPDLTGFEVLERLKADPATRDVPVIINTSKALTDEERRRLAAGAAILAKEGAAREETLAQVRAALARAGLDPTGRGEEGHHG